MRFLEYGSLRRYRMLLCQLLCVLTLICVVKTVQFLGNPTSESVDEKTEKTKDDKYDKSENDDSAMETEVDETKDKKMLDVALKTVLDPNSVIVSKNDTVNVSKHNLDDLERNNKTVPLELFIEEMDNLSLEVCKTSQEALWAYVTDINNESKKNQMIRIAAEEDEIKRQYWTILKTKYSINDSDFKDPKMRRKIRIIKERGTNVQMPQSKQREEIDTMQRIWSRVTVCAYNTSCDSEDSIKTISDVKAIFKSSNDTEELAYYWKAYRDTTGRKIRPIFQDYVSRMNAVAQSENFTDAGQMWRYAFEDETFISTVNRIWHEIKPLYTLIHDYVRVKLKRYYSDDLKSKDNLIPAHLLGNIWAQEWQSIYPKVIAYPEFSRPQISGNGTLKSKDLFDAVDEFHQSLGFESSRDSYQDILETTTTSNCLPSSHDMCDGIHYKIKWCGEKITDMAVGLSRAARLLGHVQYFKHYRNLPPLYRDGPNPAFHDALSDIVAIQMTSPTYLRSLNLAPVELGPKVTVNHQLWLALEKFPLMAYAYALDRWRWDVFGNSSVEDWNQHWWDLRIGETAISPPVPRNESDLDPAAKYHVVSHVQYITYLISHVLEFQIMLSLCRKANHIGPLHECTIYGEKEAGRLLSEGMALGASEDWRTVLKSITGETELSTEGILAYFSELELFLRNENAKSNAIDRDMDQSAPIIVGAIAVFLTVLIIVTYCIKKHDMGSGVLAFCGLTKNGSLDIVANEVPRRKSEEVPTICEEKF